MSSGKKITQTVSWGQLFILCGAIAFFLLGLVGTATLKTDINNFQFRNNVIYKYYGDEEDIVIPESYSLGDTRTETGVITFQNTSEAIDFRERYFVSGSQEWNDFYDLMYSVTYPWTYRYSIEMQGYVIGDDIQLTTINGQAFRRNQYIKKVTIPSSIINISSFAFQNCQNLEEVVFRNGCQTLGSGTFYQCNKLKKVTLSNDIVMLGERAFGYCTSLEEIVLPEALEQTRPSIFYGCTNLKTVTIKSQISAYYYNSNYDYYDPFYNCISLERVYVPREYLTYYQTTLPWSNHSSYYIGI